MTDRLWGFGEIGTLGIVDHDEVSLSNLHRQVLYTTSSISLPKAHEAASALKALNPNVNIEIFNEVFEPTSAQRIMEEGRWDAVVDATDNVGTRYLLNDACVAFNVPLVSGSALKAQGQVSSDERPWLTRIEEWGSVN